MGSIYGLWGASGKRNLKQFDEKWCPNGIKVVFLKKTLRDDYTLNLKVKLLFFWLKS